VHVTDFPVVNVHVDELSSVRIWQRKLCATYSANININNRLSIKVSFSIQWNVLQLKRLFKGDCIICERQRALYGIQCVLRIF
jgi:hypothetical protein